MRLSRSMVFFLTTITAVVLAGCGGEARGDGSGGHRDRANARAGASRGAPGTPPAAAAVPVRTAPVVRRAISSYLETNGVLEAENEVDVVARIAGPIVELDAEEGMPAARGRLLALIDDREAKADLDVAAVNRDEAKLAFERARSSWEQQLVSREAYDTALSKLKSAEAQLEGAQLKLDYTRIRAPFDGLIVKRYIKLAANVTVGTPLFRISNFTPLLCPIQVPEKELARLRTGQRATIRVEAYGEKKFPARVLRISPVVDPETGTLTVTLEADAHDKLRPGMFASVALETAVHQDALVIDKAALVLDSIGDTVYVSDGGTARRREVKLGFREGGSAEVLEGLTEGEDVIVLGQEGLADGTPVTTVTDAGIKEAAAEAPAVSPGQLEAIKKRMRRRGMSEKAIEERIAKMKEGASPQVPGAGGQGPGLPPEMLERLRGATPEQLARFKKRMLDRGMSEEQADAIIRRARGAGK